MEILECFVDEFCKIYFSDNSTKLGLIHAVDERGIVFIHATYLEAEGDTDNMKTEKDWGYAPWSSVVRITKFVSTN